MSDLSQRKLLLIYFVVMGDGMTQSTLKNVGRLFSLLGLDCFAQLQEKGGAKAKEVSPKMQSV